MNDAKTTAGLTSGLKPAAVSLSQQRMVAAERGRAQARQWRGSSSGIDTIRAKVRAEMKEEKARSRQHAQNKIDSIEAEERKREEETAELKAEARAAYAQAVEAERLQADELRAGPPNDSLDAAPEPSSELSQVERLQELFKQRAERRREDGANAEQLRQRIAARKLDSDRFGAQHHASQPPPVTLAHPKPVVAEQAPPSAVVNRNLFRWTPPDPIGAITRAAAPAPDGAEASDAARAAWEWLQRPTRVE